MWLRGPQKPEEPTTNLQLNVGLIAGISCFTSCLSFFNHQMSLERTCFLTPSMSHGQTVRRKTETTNWLCHTEHHLLPEDPPPPPACSSRGVNSWAQWKTDADRQSEASSALLPLQEPNLHKLKPASVNNKPEISRTFSCCFTIKACISQLTNKNTTSNYFSSICDLCWLNESAWAQAAVKNKWKCTLLLLL